LPPMRTWRLENRPQKDPPPGKTQTHRENSSATIERSVCGEQRMKQSGKQAGDGGTQDPKNIGGVGISLRQKVCDNKQ
jgi:hypothetical protein